MALESRTSLSNFTMRGDGDPGDAAQFDFLRAGARGETLGEPLFSVAMIRIGRGVTTRYEVTGIANGVETFWLRATARIGSTLQKSRMRSEKRDHFSAQRDEALAIALLGAFFGKRVKFDSSDAVNGLHYHLAVGAGMTPADMSDVWIRTDRGFQIFSQRFIEQAGSMMWKSLTD